ncbi:hypothetical protein A8H39_00050 [Paraburkholderia fungorum]|uniref:hypothetical protein n=1 Tax=Paraburkholderia fungorum TaxID=134537 RepID=UPI0004870EA4|nr:hypothetical protein [Paraburkholderia fungorum]PNE59578.1 hypothetical protein A8H39_00050 [Paraburkholderia fungorum]
MNSNAQQQAVGATDGQVLSLFVISGAALGDDSDTFHVIAAEDVNVATDEFKRRLLDGLRGANSEDLNDPENPELIVVDTEKIGSISGTSIVTLERQYRPTFPPVTSSRLTAEQVDALQLLKVALAAATDSGLFDELLANCKSPDSINDVCDAVAELEA